MRLLITDVTDMRRGNLCVAGWDFEQRRMVRPLPEGHHWSAELVGQHGIEPGIIVDVLPTGSAHPGTYPHLTEDMEIQSAPINVVQRGPIDWFGEDAPVSFSNIEEAFGTRIFSNRQYNGTLQGVYIPNNTKVASLAAIIIPSDDIQFIKSFDKLKAIINDDERSYQLSVSSHALKAAWLEGGIGAVKQILSNRPRFHIRLGLARAYDDDPDKCYMMLNGVHG